MPQSKPPDDRIKRRRRELGSRVRSLRLSRKVRQDALANQAGIERSTLQLIEYGNTGTTVDTLWAIADALGVPVTWFFCDDWTRPDGGGDSPDARGGVQGG